MQIFCQCLNGQTLVIEAEPYDTIEQIGEKIQEKIGICPRHQRLTSGLKSLSIFGTLADYNIQNGTTLYLNQGYTFIKFQI